MNVYQAINAVQKDLSVIGITKDRRNTQQGYNFRGIDDVFNALSPLLAKHGLCILPRVTERDQVERQSAKGGTLFFVTVGMEFDFIAAGDGSKHTIKTFGEAMDSADKATNKAMSAAYKYAALQAFAIPTEADNDTESHHHEVAPAPTLNVAELRERATLACNGGTASYAKFWKELSKEERSAIGEAQHKALKAQAQANDEVLA